MRDFLQHSQLRDGSDSHIPEEKVQVPVEETK